MKQTTGLGNIKEEIARYGQSKIARVPAICLLRVVGSPFSSAVQMSDDEAETPELFDLAEKNKMLLFYLETLRQRGELSKLRAEYDEQCQRRKKYIEELTKAAKLLNASGIDYALFKTIRPYPVVPSDADAVVLGDDREYRKAVQVFLKASYKEAVPDGPAPQAGDLMDPIEKIPIDLQNEVGVSHLVYMDKSRFKGEITQHRLPSGEEIPNLAPELDLAVVIAHSVLQEQLYLLGEFYTSVCLLSRMNEDEVKKFIRLLTNNRIVTAARHHLTVTATLCEAAYGVLPQQLENILTVIGTEESEGKRLIRSDFEMPYRFSLLTLANIFLEKIKESRFRISVASQIVHMLDPRLTRFVIRQVIVRRRRAHSVKDYVKTGIALKE